MRNDLTDLTFVIDRSGSMMSRKSDAEGGINEFISTQKQEPGECLFSLVQFDDHYEFVHKAVPIRDVKTNYQLQPRGATALLDAVGRAIVETGDRLKAMDESQRPGLVVFVIVTDGQENSSVEFTKAKIKEMVEHQQHVYKWQFTFLGTGIDAFYEAGSIGITSSMDFGEQKTGGAIRAACANVSRMRSGSRFGGVVDNFYTDVERNAVS